MPPHKILNIAPPQKILRESLSRELGIPSVIAQLLINRGITARSGADEFLNPSLNDLLDPYTFPHMKAAVHRIRQALQRKEKILLHGDYDADGVTSLALLATNLKKLGADVVYHVPHRVKEGYGMGRYIVQRCRREGVGLVITADCGISNHEVIEELKTHSIDTIVTDHHEPSSEDMPNAVAVINPKVAGCGYGFRELAGVGVAYKLCQALAGTDLPEDLDLVALGTIADSVPLRGENRIIAKEGLLRLASTQRVGLRAMIDNSSIKKMNTTAVSFIIAPRINASGRIDSAEVSLNLLMSESLEEANVLAKQVDDFNRQRQKIEAKILLEAHDLINSEVNFKEHKVIVIAKEDWHHGVLGIVASKLSDRFYRPAIVISLGDDTCRGSGRSIKSFHLFHALKECEQFLDAFGGHSHAVGLSIMRDSIQDFRTMINRLAHERLSLQDLLPSIDVDMELTLADITDELVEALALLEPFGMGNPEPLFFTRSLKLKGIPQSLGRETLKFWVTDGMFTYQAIGFGMAGLKESMVQSQSFDMIYAPRPDTWGGMQNIILQAKDLFFK